MLQTFQLPKPHCIRPSQHQSSSTCAGAIDMLQFWCLSTMTVAYHGSFRENLESYHSLIRQTQVFKKGASAMLQFWCLSPMTMAYHGSFRENLESYHSLIRQTQVFKKGASEMLQFWCLSPMTMAYHGSFRENLESAFWGFICRPCCAEVVGSRSWATSKRQGLIKIEALKTMQFWCLSPMTVAYHGSLRENLESAFWGFGVPYHNLIRQIQVFKKGTSEMLQFWCLSPMTMAYHGSFRENLDSAFWGFGVSYHSLIRQMQVFNKGASEVLQFWCLSPMAVAYHGSSRENLESAFWGSMEFASRLPRWGRWRRTARRSCGGSAKWGWRSNCRGPTGRRRWARHRRGDSTSSAFWTWKWSQSWDDGSRSATNDTGSHTHGHSDFDGWWNIGPHVGALCSLGHADDRHGHLALWHYEWIYKWNGTWAGYASCWGVHQYLGSRIPFHWWQCPSSNEVTTTASRRRWIPGCRWSMKLMGQRRRHLRRWGCKYKQLGYKKYLNQCPQLRSHIQ